MVMSGKAAAMHGVRLCMVAWALVQESTGNGDHASTRYWNMRDQLHTGIFRRLSCPRQRQRDQGAAFPAYWRHTH